MEATLSPGLAEAARDRLRSSPYSLRDVSCDVENGGLVLRGRLRTFHYKQVAQETVRRLAGVRHIVNEIEVVD